MHWLRIKIRREDICEFFSGSFHVHRVFVRRRRDHTQQLSSLCPRQNRHNNLCLKDKENLNNFRNADFQARSQLTLF